MTKKQQWAVDNPPILTLSIKTFKNRRLVFSYPNGIVIIINKMNKIMANLIILLIIGTVAGAIGQIFLKVGLNEIGIIKYSNLSLIFQSIIKIITNRFVVTGLALSVVAAFSGIIMLSQNNLNFIYPLCVGALFITVLLFSKIFLKENLNLIQFLGITIILIGIILLIKSKAG